MATCSTRRGRRSTTAALEQDEIELVLQVNGKLRGTHHGAGGRRQGDDRGARAGRREVQKFVDGAAGKKVIVVPGKLVNIVV